MKTDNMVFIAPYTFMWWQGIVMIVFMHNAMAHYVLAVIVDVCQNGAESYKSILAGDQAVYSDINSSPSSFFFSAMICHWLVVVLPTNQKLCFMFCIMEKYIE